MSQSTLPIEVVPSYPAADWKSLEAAFTALRGVAEQFQVDIVDGKFVPTQSWPFTGGHVGAELLKLQPWSKEFVLEVDCMVEAPEQYLDTICAAGAKRVIVHYGSTDAYDEIIARAIACHYEVGLAVTNDVYLADTAAVTELVSHVQFVQVMGIHTVGAQGQPFDERTLTTVRDMREQFPNRTIAVDGSVNAATIPQLKRAGVNRFAPGSAVIMSDDPAVAYQGMVALATQS